MKKLLTLLLCVMIGSLLTITKSTQEPNGPLAVGFAGWLDESETATIETVQQEKKWEPFTGWRAWAFGPEPVWLRVQVPAVDQAGAQPFALVVRPAFLDHLTFYDPTLAVTRKSGDHFSAKEDALGSVPFTFEVPALTAERTVFIQLQSTSTRVVHLSLMPMSEAQAYTRSVEWTTGFMLILSFVFWFWAITNWISTWEKVMGAFVINQSFTVLWGFFILGFARITIGPLFAEGTLSLISCVVVIGLVASVFYFFSALLKDYNARPWMLRVLLALATIAASLSLLCLVGYVQQALQIVNTITPLGLLWIALTLFFAPTSESKSHIPKLVLLAYLVIYAVVNSLPIVVYLGLIEESKFLFFGNMGQLVLNGLIMLIILNVRQRRFKEQHQAITTKLLLQEEQARLDQQYLGDQRKLLAMLAHEMKTPLANLRIWMEAGSQGRPVMERAIQDMNRVIERCVHAGQLSDQNLKPCNEWLDAAELTQSMLTTSRQPARVSLSVPPDVCAINTDAQMLLIVLGNVLENAYKYSEVDTAIEIELTPNMGSNGKPGWRWVVENTVGEAGFPDAEKVFDKYYRSASAQRQSGSGLGLFLVKSLLELLHGQATYSALQEKIRFEIWLPIDCESCPPSC